MGEKYYLMPGNAIGKEGLPKGKLECKKDAKPLAIQEKHVKIIEKNLPFLIDQKRIMTASDLAAMEEKAGGKSTKRLELEAEAVELEIDFDDKTSQKDLIAAIEAKKKELEDNGGDGE